MPRDLSSNARRYLAVWFPFLPTDRLRLRTSPSSDARAETPVVLVETVKGALRLTACDPAALKLGLSVGMTLADARARTPQIRSLIHRPEKDAGLLRRLLADFDRFTPMAALDGPDGLILDVTGCAHLFGGEDAMLRTVLDRSGRLGLQARAAMAGTPQATRAQVRFGPGGVIPQGQDRPAVRRLPVAALELASADQQALLRAGLKTLADLDDRPRATLRARFGAAMTARLDRTLGLEDVRITPVRPPDPCVVDLVLAEPITGTEEVERVLSDLIDMAVARLERTGEGGRVFEAAFYRVDGRTRRIAVRTGRPSRDAAALRRLFQERLAALSTPLDPGFGFDQLRLSVRVAERLPYAQVGLEGGADRSADLDDLVDRLAARLGEASVLRFEPRDSHLPERAMGLVSASRARPDWPESEPEEVPTRPLRMFDPPQPIETLALASDSPPRRFRWRRVMHEVARAEGPERIAPEWWREPDGRTRDYYRVEDRQGRRFWLFRQGLYGEADEPRWFIHGLFA